MLNISAPSKRRLSVPSFRRVLGTRIESSKHRRNRLEAARINDLAPIYSLPPELLCHIFLFYAAASWIPLQETSGLGWLAITHVSHRWREVASACPELWAHIILRRKLVPIMLARAKDVPLLIRVDLDNNNHLKPEHIRENIARAGLLDVRGSQGVLDTFFIDHVGKISAPRLRSLSVANTTEGDPVWLDAGVFHGMEEPRIHMPRQLRLEQCALPWNSPWYFNLTNLYLANLHKAHSTTMTMLLSVLTASPLLEDLALIDTQTCADDFNRDFPLVLPHLHTIRLGEPISVCDQILMNLSFPSVVKVGISIPDDPSDTLLCHHDFFQTFNFLHIDAPTSGCYSIYASSYHTDHTLRVEVRHGSRERPSLAPMLDSLGVSRVNFFSSIDTLSVSGVVLEMDAWRHLRNCSSLEILTFRGATDPVPLLALLLERAMRRIGVSISPEVETDLRPDGACRQLFPYLAYIGLNDIDCGDPESYPSTTDVLRALLWARRAGRCPIPRVGLEECKNVFQQDLDYLERLADSFSWDGEGKNLKEKDESELDMRSFSLNVLEHLKSSLC
ncbi:hypothetical protein K438DRAFT_1797454 [Mycena galopus ATCC 62051]|nr:hypothetical protein K438DRAFT_1797454 [Mycena galopus ATCC 62051]